jgi:UDP-N-acetylglucosamine acyltransferase
MAAVIGHEPQHFAYQGEPTQTLVGDRVIVRENVTIHRSTGEGTQTQVGNDCMLMVGSHVAHNCRLGEGVILANGAQLAGHVQVDERALVSGNVVIHQFVRIGRYSILSGGSRFGMDVPPYLIGDGTNTVTGLNSVGLRRSKELSDADRLQIRSAFKILYRSGHELGEALARLRVEFDSEAIRSWVEFFANPSPRGFCRYKATRRQ